MKISDMKMALVKSYLPVKRVFPWVITFIRVTSRYRTRHHYDILFSFPIKCEDCNTKHKNNPMTVFDLDAM